MLKVQTKNILAHLVLSILGQYNKMVDLGCILAMLTGWIEKHRDSPVP